MKLVFFDLDGTLITGNSWEGIFQYPHISPFRLAWLRVSIMPYILLRRLYLLGETGFYQVWMGKIARLIKNWPQNERDDLFQWLAHDFLQDSYRVLDVLHLHKAEGAHVVLVSILFEDGVRKICERLNVDGAIGTALEIKNGKASGKIIGNVCFGSRRLDFLRHYLSVHAPDISLEDCIAYADSYSDAPMLAIVGKAVAVYPDKNLKAAALEQNWEIYQPLT